MPISRELLDVAATDAFGLYADNPVLAVRGGSFSNIFEYYAQAELERLELPPQPMVSNRRVRQSFSFSRTAYMLGGHYLKNVDVTLNASTSGPLLSISVKSMLSSIGNNVNNRWEEAIGDAANMHARFPMLVYGFLMILPTRSRLDPPEVIINEDGTPTPLAQQIVRKLSAARGRRASTELPSFYEEIAVAVFDADAPFGLHPTFPAAESGLRLEGYFDRLAQLFRERNPSL